MFSIIIPLYNKALYIEKAICSVFAQTCQEFELIVVDDGSTDNSLEIAKALQLSTFNFQLITQENGGVSVARNNGVKVAKYSYICFLDADDWWETTYLEEMKFLINDFPDAGIYGCNYYVLKNNKTRLPRNGVDDRFRGYIDYFKSYAKGGEMTLWTGSVVIPKSIYQEMVGFKPQLKLGEDFDLWVRIAIKYPVAYFNKALAYYNQDVIELKRGVVKDKIYLPETHFIFNLDYLAEEEIKNPDLKKLLDRLRVYTLERYRVQNAFPSFYKKEIQKVDFKHQPFSVWLLYYIIPPFVLLLKTKGKKKIKSMLK